MTIKRTTEEKKKLMEMPVAKRVKGDMESIVQKLEVLSMEQKDLVDELTYWQLFYKVYVHGELTQSEAVLFKQLGLQLNQSCEFKYEVLDNDSSKK